MGEFNLHVATTRVALPTYPLLNTHLGAQVDVRQLGAVVPQPRAGHPGHCSAEDLREAAGV
jgi:hypothetical protein